MTTSIATQAPNYGHLTGQQPVGHKQLVLGAVYAATVTIVTRANAHYWAVTTVETKGAFAATRRPGVSAQVWLHPAAGQYVVDYSDGAGTYVEVTRSYDLRAALGVAVWSTSERGHALGRW